MMPGNRMQMAGQQMNPNMGMLGQVGGPGQIMPGQIMQGQQRGPAPPYMNPSPGESHLTPLFNQHLHFNGSKLKNCFVQIRDQD